MKKTTYSVNGPVMWFKWTALVGVLVTFGFMLWYASAEQDRLLADMSSPKLIKSPDGPIKVRAENPGGMKIPHQDKKVFDLLANKKTVGIIKSVKCKTVNGAVVCGRIEPVEVEKLVKKDVPKYISKNVKVVVADKTTTGKMQVEKSPITKNTASIASLIAQDTDSKTASLEKAAENSVKEVVVAVKSSKANVDNVAIEKTSAPQASDTQKETLISKNVPVNGWGVQLGSYASKSDAESGIVKFRNKMPALLTDMSPRIQSANVKGRRYHRVQFFNGANKTASRKLCTQIKAQGQGCLYVKF